MFVGISIEPLSRGTDSFGPTESVDCFLVNDFFQSHHLNKYILNRVKTNNSSINYWIVFHILAYWFLLQTYYQSHLLSTINTLILAFAQILEKVYLIFFRRRFSRPETHSWIRRGTRRHILFRYFPSFLFFFLEKGLTLSLYQLVSGKRVVL